MRNPTHDTLTTEPRGQGQAAPSGAGWMPIVPLSSRHRGQIERHLLGLAARDRYLRFGYSVTDDRMKAFVSQLDFGRDTFFGLYDRTLELVGLAQLAYASPDLAGAADSATVEFAVSVSPTARGRGYGRRLFRHAVRRANSTGVERLLIHALSENAAMLHIAQQAGAVVARHGSESEAWLELPPQNPGTRWRMRAGDQWALWLHGLRQQQQHALRSCHAAAQSVWRLAHPHPSTR